MKKVLTVAMAIFCACVLRAEGASRVHLNTGLQYKTEHINRGRPELTKAIIGNVELGFDASDKVTVYGGVDAALGIDSNDSTNARNDIAPYVGCSYDITDDISLDGGYIHHFYTAEDAESEDDGSGVLNLINRVEEFKLQSKYKDSGEIYVGIFTRYILAPSVYCFYDFKKEEFAAEGTVSHSFDLSDRILSGLSAKVYGKIGYDKAKKPFGIRMSMKRFIHENEDSFKDQGYFYYGLGFDLVLTVAEKVNFSAGVAYEGNAASKDDLCNMYTNGKRKDATVFKASIGCSF